jgi:hypothetical protein
LRKSRHAERNTIFRSSPGSAAAAASAVAHPLQNLAASVFAVPHLGQITG